MAAPSYTHDLTTYNDCTSATGWIELVGMALSAPPDVDSDLAIHGSICITSDRAKVGLSSNAFVGAGFTLASGECVFVWHKFFAPNSLATLANGGVRVMIGDSSSVYDGWYLDGSDTYAYGGWVNHVVDPTTSPDQTAGTTTGTYAMVGNGWNLPTQAPQKGNPFGTDIIRYGRGNSIFTDGDLANGYATFGGYAIVNDNPTTGRLGLIQAEGAGYLYKGLMSLGSGTTAVDFRDSNTSVTIDNTSKVSSGFNKIEINNTSSYVEMLSIAFTSLGTVSPGTLEMVDNASVIFDSCNFTLMSDFTFLSNFTGNTCTWTQCGLVTQGGSQLDGCVFNKSTGTTQLLADNIDIVTNCTFIGNSFTHGIELTTAHAAGTYTLDGCVFENFGLTGSTTAGIYNNSAGHVDISVINGDAPTVRDGIGASTTFVFSVILTMTVKDTDGLPIEDAFAYIDDDNAPTYIMNELTTAAGIATETWTGGAVVGATWRVRKYGYKPYKLITDVPATGSKDIPVTLVTDLQQT